MEKTEEKVWKDSFFLENFNVDQCLSKYTLKSDLETLRSDLKNYAEELHQQMAEILKAETEAIVNLAEYLTNLSSEIENLRAPLSQLREEIKSLYELIKTAEMSYFTTLETIKSNSTKRNCLNLKAGIISSAMYIDKMLKTNATLFEDSNSIMLERIVNKYSFEFSYLQEFGLDADIQEIAVVGRKLTDLVREIFLRSIAKNDADVILRSLRMYDNLGEHGKAEEAHRSTVVRPVLANLFTEATLERNGQDLERIYAKAMDFLSDHVAPILDVLKRNPELRSFNFVLRSFWPEVDKQSREGLPHITAPGNPELFQRRFKTTWLFLSKIAELCGEPSLLYTNESFQNHIKRFNLPVYFEIRFQQIAGQFETEAINKPSAEMYASRDFKLKITETLRSCLQRTFHADVFIDNLADQFLKLSMLLVARYVKWFEEALRAKSGAEEREDFVLFAIDDLRRVEGLVGRKGGDLGVYGAMPASTRQNLGNVFALNVEIVTGLVGKLETHLIELKINESVSQLQNVASIPRLYRRTNRVAPKEPSNYVLEAVRPILKFSKRGQSLEAILDPVITKITKQYLTLVDEVLRSVCKTEESLRRLKSRNTQITESVGDDAENSDEMKIRDQIRLDVAYFINTLEPCVLEGGKSAMSELHRKTR